jgi:glycosyltransferase involved in cell wall biosynthesis
MVVTVHDLIYELFPHLFRNSKQVIDMKKKLIDQASLLIAVSECTKRDLINVYNVSENKIKVIYHAASLSHLTTKNKIASPFILFVGQRAAYKNFDVLTVAFSKVLKKHNVNLICVGGGAFTQGELHKFEALKIENYSIQKSATKEELAGLYSQAICLVYPSLYEGFGIPILEAFSLECPVVCSDIAIFREIAGTAALYFDPNSSKSISDALSNVIENDDLTIQLRKYGALQNEKYSWQRAAELTRDAYLEVAQP